MLAGLRCRKRSIAWATAQALHEAGANLAFTYQGERLKEIPASRKKREVILRWLAERFEVRRRYSEAEVNELLQRYHPDSATLRRERLRAFNCASRRQRYRASHCRRAQRGDFPDLSCDRAR